MMISLQALKNLRVLVERAVSRIVNGACEIP